jgi:hypothetical protein
MQNYRPVLIIGVQNDLYLQVSFSSLPYRLTAGRRCGRRVVTIMPVNTIGRFLRLVGQTGDFRFKQNKLGELHRR